MPQRYAERYICCMWGNGTGRPPPAYGPLVRAVRLIIFLVAAWRAASSTVLRPEESLWWEGFIRDVGFEPGVRGSYGLWEWWVDRKSRCGRSKKGESEIERLGWGWWREVGSWFQRQAEAYLKERSVMRNEDDVGGRARVTSDEKRVLRGGWTEIRIFIY